MRSIQESINKVVIGESPDLADCISPVKMHLINEDLPLTTLPSKDYQESTSHSLEVEKRDS